MNECIFCSIINGDKEKLVWESQTAAAFNDIHPDAPVHVLLVPKEHIAKLDDLKDQALAGSLLSSVPEVAQKIGVSGAYRVRINNGRDAGQVVDHLHIHILGGKTFRE